MPKAFSGTLNTNEWFNNFYNAYLLVKTIADGLSGMNKFVMIMVLRANLRLIQTFIMTNLFIRM